MRESGESEEGRRKRLRLKFTGNRSFPDIHLSASVKRQFYTISKFICIARAQAKHGIFLLGNGIKWYTDGIGFSLVCIREF